ncbi:MAG TPA: Uma2 family endonuclease [Candidatus Ozemobacteraceae bacterium]|mgnify:FL=1|nr:Uma2 family endonuclease [Candidatus Ozemobacteraceae bacterium]
MPNLARKLGGRFTYGDYRSWSEEDRWELIDGVAYDMTPAPARIHADLSMALLKQLLAYFEEKSCKVYHAPFDVRLPEGNEPDDEIETVVQPDLLVVCDEKKLDDKGCRGAPDLVIEILSPATASKDCILKRALYEKHGVREFWLVDPANRVATVYSLGADRLFGKPAIYSDEDTVQAGLFPDLNVDFGKVFPAQPKTVRERPARYL